MYVMDANSACKANQSSLGINYGQKVEAIPLKYAIQFDPYGGNNANYDKELGLGDSVVMLLISRLSANLLLLLKYKGIAAIGTVGEKRMGNLPQSSVDRMKKQPRGTCDVIVDSKPNASLERQQSCHSSLNCVWEETSEVVKRFIKDRGRVEINQPNSIVVYNRTIGRVDKMDQNIGAYMKNFHSKK